MGVYSDFWLIGRGRLTLPDWKQKPYEPFEPLPTPAELEVFAQQPLEVRQAAEQAGYGFVVSIADSQDRKRARRATRKQAA